MADKQIVEELLARSPIFMIVAFGISFCLCVMLLPLRGRQKVYASTILSIIVPQLACIFPMYFYIFFLHEAGRPTTAKIFWSTQSLSIFVSPQWIALLILSIVIFVRHFRDEGRSYLGDAIAALVIGGTFPTLVAFAALTGAEVEPVEIGQVGSHGRPYTGFE
jgi:hypothetical protein